MKRLILLMTCLLSQALYAETLEVPPGETLLIDEGRTELVLQRISLGDNAVIRFAPGVSQWRVSAEQAVIGDNVLIDGRGEPGMAGSPGDSIPGQARDCDDGLPGLPGVAAGAGGNGVNIQMNLGVVSVGGLQVKVDGGVGGRGGAGGSGQLGGDIDHCRGGTGGAGGAGGAGGPGGDAGLADIRYWSAGDMDTDTIRQRIVISSQPGSGGLGGDGGAGGPGVEGRYQKGAFAGSGKRWLAGGKTGETGPSGAPGQAGQRGEVRLVENLKKSLGKMIKTAGQRSGKSVKSDSGTTSDSVLQQVQRLQARLDALEKRLNTLESKQ